MMRQCWDLEGSKRPTMKTISSDLLKQVGISSEAILDKDGLVRKAPPTIEHSTYNVVLPNIYNSM